MEQLDGIWIPQEILYSHISPLERLVMAEILALSNNRPCTMSNEQMACKLNLNKRQIMRAIKKLSNEGYISIHYPSNTKREILTSTKNCTPTKNGSTKNCTPTKNGSELVQKFVSTSTKNCTQVYIENKKENSSIYDPLKPFIDFYNNNIEILTPHNLTILQSYVEDYGEEWTMKALEYVAEAERGKRNIKYLGGVLKGWERDGELRPWEKQKCEDTRPDRPYVSDLMKAAGYEY